MVHHEASVKVCNLLYGQSTRGCLSVSLPACLLASRPAGQPAVESIPTVWCLLARGDHPPPPPVQEMEAAAVAWSADLFGCPVFCLKSITDIVDGDRPAQVWASWGGAGGWRALAGLRHCQRAA